MNHLARVDDVAANLRVGDRLPKDVEADVSLLEAMVAYALSIGMSRRRVEEVTGMTFGMLQPSRRRVPAQKLVSLLSEMSYMHPSRAVSIGVAGLTADYVGMGVARSGQFAPTVRSALHLFGRCSSLFVDGLQLSLEEGDRSAVLAASHPQDAVDDGRLVELISLFIWRFICTHAKGQPEVSEVSLHASRQILGPAYEAFFRAPVSFTGVASGTVIVLPRSLLDVSLRFACPAFFELAEEEHVSQLPQSAAGSRRPQELTRLLNAVAIIAQEGQFSVEDLAKASAMSVRSAQRLASRCDVSLRDLLTEWRMNLAKKRLASEPTLRMADLAEALGYADERSFRRAFKRWTGRSPSSFRRLDSAPLGQPAVDRMLSADGLGAV